MEEGKTYTAEFDLLGRMYRVSAVPFAAGKEWRFRVHIEPGNIDTVFQYMQSEERDGLGVVTRGIVPEPLEEEIGEWIEGEDL